MQNQAGRLLCLLAKRGVRVSYWGDDGLYWVSALPFRHVTADTTTPLQSFRHVTTDTTTPLQSFRHVTTDKTTPLQLFRHVTTDTTTPLQSFRHVITDTTTPLQSFRHVTTDTTTPLQSFRHVITDTTTPLQSFRHVTTDTTTPLQSPLHQLHLEHAGRMVEYAGYSLPLRYGDQDVMQSHRHTRQHCSLFDVSHMLQARVGGTDATEAVESLLVSDLRELPEDTGTLSVFTGHSGGILDDLIVMRTSAGPLYLVANAACRHKDLALLQTCVDHMRLQDRDVWLEELSDHALLAVQGPATAELLQPHTPLPLQQLPFLRSAETLVGSVPCRLTRCGYTGEDGVELSLPADAAARVAALLLTSSGGRMKLAGLGARDSLRLETGLCLYGCELDEHTTPVEAGLAWTVGKRRRRYADFPGAATILAQLRHGPVRRRIGLVSQGAPARAGVQVLCASTGTPVGLVTSGGPAPSLSGSNVSMAYVSADCSVPGTQLTLLVRKQRVQATVVKLPFITAKYFTNVT